MKFGTKEIVAIGVPYLVAVGACYLFGYWGAFRINVLEYISFADVAKIALYPLIVSVGFIFVGVALPELACGASLRSGGGRETVIGQFILRYIRFFVIGIIFIIITLAIFGPEPHKWQTIAGLLCLFSIWLANSEKVIEIIPDAKFRNILIFLLVALPTFGFAYGRTDAYFVKKGYADNFIDIARSNLPLIDDGKNRVAYLGLLGNLYVLREGKTGHIVFVKQRDDSPLFLVPKNDSASPSMPQPATQACPG